MMFSPYVKIKHDYTSVLCQMQIFFALLAAVILKSSPSPDSIDTVGRILMLICAVPPLGIGVLNSPAGKYICDDEKREQLGEKLDKVWAKISTKLEVAYAKASGRYYKVPTEEEGAAAPKKEKLSLVSKWSARCCGGIARCC